ncbi:hypothetical protein [Mycobacterium sp.]|uniref:hypothetical protein n=1 Tax=Mycobacterium sp. TaxID=1785 RepID=UPI003F9BD3CE
MCVLLQRAAHTGQATIAANRAAAASTITVKYTDQSTKKPIPDYPEGNLVTSATATSQTVESTLDLAGQPDFFPDGAFTPDVTVKADEQGPRYSG